MAWVASMSSRRRKPRSSLVLELHASVGVVHPTHHMILILPNRAPHGNIVKALVENPGDVHALSQWLDHLTHRRQRLLHFRRFTDTASFLTTKESMREDAAPPGVTPSTLSVR